MRTMIEAGSSDAFVVSAISAGRVILVVVCLALLAHAVSQRQTVLRNRTAVSEGATVVHEAGSNKKKRRQRKQARDSAEQQGSEEDGSTDEPTDIEAASMTEEVTTSDSEVVSGVSDTDNGAEGVEDKGPDGVEEATAGFPTPDELAVQESAPVPEAPVPSDGAELEVMTSNDQVVPTQKDAGSSDGSPVALTQATENKENCALCKCEDASAWGCAKCATYSTILLLAHRAVSLRVEQGPPGLTLEQQDFEVPKMVDRLPSNNACRREKNKQIKAHLKAKAKATAKAKAKVAQPVFVPPPVNTTDFFSGEWVTESL